MEIVDANAGLLSNFEVYQFLTDKQKNKSESSHTRDSTTSRVYPPYDEYLVALEQQKQHDFTASFLSASEVKKLEAENAPNHTTASSTAATSTSSTTVEPPPPNAFKRDYKPLEGTCWVKSKVLNYLSATPAATQTSASIAAFIRESKILLQQRAGDNKIKEEDTRLTVCELISLLNIRPTSLVEIHRAIEECEERFSEEDTLALLELIMNTLPPAPKRENADGNAATTGMDVDS